MSQFLILNTCRYFFNIMSIDVSSLRKFKNLNDDYVEKVTINRSNNDTIFMNSIILKVNNEKKQKKSFEICSYFIVIISL